VLLDPHTDSGHSSAISAENRWYWPAYSTTDEPHRVQFPAGCTTATTAAGLAGGCRLSAAQLGPLAQIWQRHVPATHEPAREQSRSVLQPATASSSCGSSGSSISVSTMRAPSPRPRESRVVVPRAHAFLKVGGITPLNQIRVCLRWVQGGWIPSRRRASTWASSIDVNTYRLIEGIRPVCPVSRCV
jgi:hypothetical protein